MFLESEGVAYQVAYPETFSNWTDLVETMLLDHFLLMNCPICLVISDLDVTQTRG